jgi:glutamate--cysteine ligase
VPPNYEQRLQQLADAEQNALLRGIQRGIEKEALRVTPGGKLAQTRHPAALGSALTNPFITTDYSEALLEFITPVDTGVASTLQTLDDIHRFVYQQLDGELLWGASMPCILEGDEHIPVALYGASNVAQMKTVYRQGLGHRYGRLMQTIAGIHYNFSMPLEFWASAREAEGESGHRKDYITSRYLGLIRNFQRHSWLLIYLFGASPAVCRSFLRGSEDHNLQPFDAAGNTMYLPHGTSLRMGDLGYQSNAQKDLEVCYNDLDSYVDTLHRAITEPHPDYVAMGLRNGSEWLQLNTSLLQIENEFYSPIRPKRVADSGETPLGALRRGGIEYIEVRCIDINPTQPLGIDEPQIRFLDTFLLYCLLQDSPPCDDAETQLIAENLQRVVNRGREPGLSLLRGGAEVPLSEVAHDMLNEMEPIARALDQSHGGMDYLEVLNQQRGKIDDPESTPAARLLAEMQQQDIPFFRLAMNYSQRWAEHFRSPALPAERSSHFQKIAAQSIVKQQAVEADDSIDFTTYLRDYYRQYESFSTR